MRFVDYRCNQCSRVRELVIGADTDIRCPECGSRDMLRIFSGPILANTELKPTAGKGCSGSCANCSGCS
ncbi:MAG: hypothetical protein PHN32_04115 [Actinomycetota bacterium]|nr:hypothetical protein [Actinomycetota bacterium]